MKNPLHLTKDEKLVGMGLLVFILVLNVSLLPQYRTFLLLLEGLLASSATGGDNTGGNSTGGNNTGGNSTGGNNTGGNNTGGNNTGGDNTGGNNTGEEITQVETTQVVGIRAGTTPEETILAAITQAVETQVAELPD